MKKTPDYGNWVPRKMLYMQICMIVAFILLAIVIPAIVLKIVFCIGTLAGLGMIIYFGSSHYVFSYNGGGLSGKILDMMLSYLQPDKKEKILDIGCGSGALTIKIAKKFPAAKITGIDYWGAEWDYKKDQCQKNAALEGVSGQVTFLQGSASNLPFEDESFDVVVSNFTFHEVKDTKNKHDVIKEALRVVKKGGVFVFHDIFYINKIYGEPEEMIEKLRASDISEIHIINTSTLEIIPKFLRTSFMLGGIGLIYGKK
jgi:SAM-dependent methyltransferase